MKTLEKIALVTFALVFAVELIASVISDKQETIQEQAAKAEMLQRIDTLRDENQKITDENRKLRDELREKNESRGGERGSVLTSLGAYTLTAYCGCEKCCGKYARNRPGGIVRGATGIELQEGVSVAAPLPIGTVLLINGHKYIVQDRTAGWIVDRYDGRIIDIYYLDHEAAKIFGKQQAEVFSVK
jgi:hypothetical protein